MLDPRRLRVLLEVGRRGSLSAAADVLGYTQPAVSHHIARLEREAGTKLTERTARGVRLTDAGALLAGHADAIDARLLAAEADLGDLLGLRTGALGLGGFPTAFVDLVPSAVAELRREHPGLAVTLRQAGRDEAVRLLRGGELDVAVVFVAGEPLDLDGDLAADDLLSEPMLVVLPRTHRLAARRAVRLADLARDRWVRGTQPDGVLDRAAAAAGFEPDVAFETDDVLAVQGLVAAGVAVSLAPGLALANTRDDVVVRPLAGEPVRREIFALTRAGSAPGARAAVAALRRAGAELGARLGMPGARRR